MNFLRWIWNVIVGAWAIFCGVTSYSDEQIRTFIRTMLIILGIELGAFLLGFILNMKVIIFFAGIISSLTMLVCWKAGDLAVKVILSFTNGLPLVKSVIAPTMDELKKLLSPMLTLSLFLAFLAAIVAIKGPAYFTWTDLMVWTGIIIATEIFTLYVGAKMKLVGWAMVAFMYYLLIGSYVWSVQVQGVVNFIDRSSANKAIAAMEESRNYDMVIINNGTPLYELGWFGKFKRLRSLTEGAVVAKVIKTTDDPMSKEPMYLVLLPIAKIEPTADDIYVGGDTVYVPARLTTAVVKPQKPVQQSTAQNSTLQLGLETMPVGVHHFTVEKNTSTDWIKIPGNAYWDLSSTKTGNFKVITYDGKIITYTADGGKIGDFPNQAMVFKIQSDEEMGFILKVRPKVNPKA